MNIKVKKFLSNFSITLFANFLSMAVSSIVILIIPTIIGITDYGYWQLYIFYCSYTSYFSFGLTDGVYLRNGGKKFSELNFDQIRPQYWLLLIINIILTTVITIFFIFTNTDCNKILIGFFACLSAIIIIPRSLLTMTMLSVNRIKENAMVLVADRGVYLLLVILFFIFKINDFYFLILSDLLAQLLSSILAVFLCKDLVIGKFNFNIDSVLSEAKINATIGIKIVIAGLASMLIVGIIRLGIESQWGVETSAKVSLTISVCNLFLIFIKAISVVIFPVLCNCNLNILKKIYSISSDSLGIILLGSFILYYPGKIILSFWLPQYAESLAYMAMLFPISLYESKTQLLLNTYFKALRKENLLLMINVMSVLLSLIVTILTINILNSVDLAIFAIVFLLAFRCYLSEFMLLKIVKINGNKDIIYELIMSVLFILLNWYIGGISGVIIYIFIYFVYLFLKRDKLKFLIDNIKGTIFGSKEAS